MVHQNHDIFSYHHTRSPFILTPRFPFLWLFSPPPPPPPPRELNRSHSLLCCDVFARGHRKTAENLCWYNRPFHKVCPQYLKEWPPTQRFDMQAADRPIQVLTQCQAAWLGWLPGTGHLLHTERCRSTTFKYYFYDHLGDSIPSRACATPFRHEHR